MTIPLPYQMLLVLCVFLTLVAYHARLVEVTSRLDFLWKREAQRELAEMRETRRNNRQLLRNILPDHVANHFLNQDRQTDVSCCDYLLLIMPYNNVDIILFLQNNLYIVIKTLYN